MKVNTAMNCQTKIGKLSNVNLPIIVIILNIIDSTCQLILKT